MQLLWLIVSTVLFFNFLQISEGQFFSSENENHCVTPNNRSGECRIIYDCESVVKALDKRYLTQETIQYLRTSVCSHSRDVPVVCCEKDAGHCIDPSNTPGTCIPLERCNHLMKLMEQKPFLDDKTVSYLRLSECHYRNDDKARVCCPFYKRIQLVSRVNVEEEPTVVLPDPAKEECGIESSPKIIGGTIAGIYEHPWMALIQYKSNNMLGCGGSIINERYILTAAHCVVGPSVTKVGNVSKIILGEHNTNSSEDCEIDHVTGDRDCTDDPILVDFEEIIPHPSFNSLSNDRSADIALIRLKQKLDFGGDFIKPVCLPQSGMKLGDKFIAVGWGRTENSSGSNLKLKVSLPIFNRTKCGEMFQKSINKLTLGPGQFCVGGVAGKDSCSGDSGGPLLINVTMNQNRPFFQVGIVSFGPQPCGLHNRPGVYTLVSQYMPWILKNLRP